MFFQQSKTSMSKRMLLLVVVVLLIDVENSLVRSQKFDSVLAIAEALDLKNPWIVEASTLLQQIRSVKAFNNVNHIVRGTKFLHKIEETTCDVIIHLNADIISQIMENTWSPNAFSSKTVLIVSNDTDFQDVEGLLLLDINQKVYFFSTTTFEVSESYQINKVNINRKLGRIVKKNGVNLFSWKENIFTK